MKKLIISIALAITCLPSPAEVATPLPSREGQGGSVLSLSDCLSMASTHNRTLQNAALEIQAANEQSSEAYTKYFPQISANVMAFQMFDKLFKGNGTYPEELKALAAINPAYAQLAGTPYSYSEFNKAFAASASAILPLYAGGQIHNGNKLAKIGTEVATLQKDLKEKDILQKVTECYWQIAKVKYNLQTIAAAEKQITAVRSQVEDYVNAGMTNRNALLQVKLRQQELASNRLKLENAQHVLCMLLAQEIGSPKENIDIVLPEGMDTPTLPAHSNSDEAALNRIELKLAGKGVEAQQLQIKMERGKCLPTLAVGAMGFYNTFGGLSETVKANINTSITNGLVFGTLSVPISAWWGGSHAIKRQKIKLQEAQNTYDDAREQLAIDIESAWSNLTEAYKQIEISKASVEEAEENLRLNTDQYKAGTTTITDLLDAETLNRKAKDQLSAALADYQIKKSDYERKTK